MARALVLDAIRALELAGLANVAAGPRGAVELRLKSGEMFRLGAAGVTRTR